MSKISNEPTWTRWPQDRAVEYEVRNGFLRIRRFEAGQMRTSAWREVDGNVDAVIRRHVQAFDGVDLPPLVGHTPSRSLSARFRALTADLEVPDWVRRGLERVRPR